MGARQPELRRRQFTFWRVVFRYFTGRPLDGVRRTDAIFLRRGRSSMDPSGWASPWSYLAGWERLVVRLFALYVAAWGLLLLAAWALRRVAGEWAPEWAERWTLGHALAVHVLWAAALGAIPGALWAVRYWGLSLRVPVLAVERDPDFPWVQVHLDGWTPVEIPGRRDWTRRYVRPVAAAASGVLGVSRPAKEAPRWVHVPRTFRDPDGAPVSIQLPAAFTGDPGVQKRLVSAVGNRLGLRDPSVTWDLEGDRPRVLIQAAPLPPSRVSFADLREALEVAEEYEVVLGMAARGQVLKAHLVGESPHIAVSAGPGAGKSELVKVMIMLALRWGWGVIILDWKEVSHDWAADLPGVLYCRDIEDIHDMGVRLGQEVDSRKGLYRRDRTMPGKAKVLVVAEEMNVTADLLSAYWTDLRQTAEPEERASMPLKSPALRGLQAVNFGGRQFGMFMCFIAQRFSARVTNGNADLRESFQIRLLARSTQQTQKMLAPQIKPWPKVGVEPGRWVAVIGQEAVVYQAALITDKEAQEFALGGQENPSSPLTGTHGVAGGSQAKMDHGLGIPLPRGAARDSQDPLELEGEVLASVDARKLSDMVDGLAPLGITLKILQKAAGDPESGFPGAYGGTPNRGYTYDYQAVQEWARKRHASRVAKGEVTK